MTKTKTAKKSSAKKGRRQGPRASWKGALRLSLVSVPVQAFNAAAKKEEVHLHQLHAGCHRRVRYQKACPVHGELSNDEIISGYEYKKGRYVEITSDDLDKLRTDKGRELTIDGFIGPNEIDPIHYDGRVYYLVPDGEPANGPYAVLREALERQGLYGLGQIVFSGKEQLVVVRPLDGLIAMLMLTYVNQLRTPQLFADQLPRKAPSGKEVEMAEKLIQAITGDGFDFEQYEDRYLRRLHELIEAKVAGDEIVAPEPQEEPSEVINLMDALKQSVQRAKSETKAKERSAFSAQRHSTRGSSKKIAAKGSRRAS